tara:strand:- start:1521 stop:1907 length:387 start_codon:yes stop_codon:yes gene_type:complete
MKIKINIKPLTVNAVYVGRRYKTADYRAYREDVGWQLKGIEKIPGFVEINYKFYVRYWWGRDVDNMIKPIQDILVKNNIIDDDINVIKVIAEKIAIPKEQDDFMEIEINPIKNETTKLWKLKKLASQK